MTDLENRTAGGTDVATTSPPEGATSAPKHATWALVLICIAQLMVVLDATIANIALPFIGRDLDITSQSSLSWIVTGYALAFGGLLLLGGRLGDLYGKRNIFMVGVTIFAIASAVGGLAQNEAMLLGSRGVQGLGAALASPSALALITTTFPAGPARNRAFSVFAAMAGLGAAIGLILGGWLTGLDPSIGWRLTFLINVPIGLGAAFFAPRLLGKSENQPGRLDVPGAIIGTAGILGVVYGITRTGQSDPSTVTASNMQGTPYGWSDVAALVSIGVGVVLLIAFVLIETRTKLPLLPLRLFASRNRAAAFVVMMLAPAAMFGMFFYLSQYIQNVMGYSPLKTGFAFLPFSVGIIIGSAVSSNIVSRIDARYMAGAGTLLASFSLFMFHRLDPGSVNYWADLMPYIFVMSIGMGLVFVPMTLVAVHRIKAQDAGIGSGVLNTMQQVGGAIGLAILSTAGAHYISERASDLQSGAGLEVPTLSATKAAMAHAFQVDAFAHGATGAFLVASILMLVASAIAWIFLSVKHDELATDEDTPAGMA